MIFKEKKIIHKVLESLFKTYSERVPDVKKITNGLIKYKVIEKQEDIINDHIAFRTLGVKHLGIQSLEKIFIHHGYEKRDYYNFDKKKLNAYWYSHPEKNMPRIFISELRVNDLSTSTRNIIYKYTSQVKSDPVKKLNLNSHHEIIEFLSSPLWELPSITDYDTLLDESEYASWVIYNRYYLNHYTISVHDLPKNYNNLENFKYLQLNFSDKNDLHKNESIFHDCDVLIHLGARAGVRQSFKDPEKYLMDNTLGTTNLSLQVKENRIPKFIIASTSSIYGDTGKQLAVENKDELFNPPSVYASTKSFGETLAKNILEDSSTLIKIARFFTVYGPFGRPDMSILRFIHWIASGQDVIIYGDGNQRRSFTYISDIVDGIQKLLKYKKEGTFNFGSNNLRIFLPGIDTSLPSFKHSDVSVSSSLHLIIFM